MAVKVLNRVRNLTRMRTAGLAVSAFMGICCTSTPQDRNKGVRYLFPPDVGNWLLSAAQKKVPGTFFGVTPISAKAVEEGATPRRYNKFRGACIDGRKAQHYYLG